MTTATTMIQVLLGGGGGGLGGEYVAGGTAPYGDVPVGNGGGVGVPYTPGGGGVGAPGVGGGAAIERGKEFGYFTSGPSPAAPAGADGKRPVHPSAIRRGRALS